MIRGSECVILTEDEARALLKIFYVLIDGKGKEGYKQLREAGVLELFDQIRTFVRSL